MQHPTPATRATVTDVRMQGFRQRSEVDDVLAWVDANATPLPATVVDVDVASGRVLAEAVRAPIDVPAFDRSSMDGYALAGAETHGASDYNPLSFEVTGQALTGLKDYSVFERVWALPTFEIHGIKGGFVGDGAKTVIPAQATAKISLRLVPGQTYAKVAKQLERAVADLAPRWADVQVKLQHGGDPVQVDVSHPAFEVLDAAFSSVTGRSAVRIRAGGSIPIVPQLGLTGAPVILTGIGLPDDGLHSPNEKLDLAQLWSGIEIFGRFFELFAERGATPPTAPPPASPA